MVVSPKYPKLFGSKEFITGNRYKQALMTSRPGIIDLEALGRGKAIDPSVLLLMAFTATLHGKGLSNRR